MASQFGESYCKTLILHKEPKSMVFNGNYMDRIYQDRKTAHL